MNAVTKDGHNSHGEVAGRVTAAKVKVVTFRLEDKHIEMLKTIADSYRIPHNVSHAVRLMIEDKFKEVVDKVIPVTKEIGGDGHITTDSR